MDYKTADCKYSIFCNTWGEWKCKKLCGYITENDCENCDKFEKNSGEKPACRCETCEERVPEED